MARTTIGFGILLALVGGVAYLLSGGASVTALIPAFFGAPLVVLGLVALKPEARAAAMHVAAIVGLLGVVGALFRPLKAALGDGLDMNAPVITQLLMAAICAVFVVLCVRSFVQARRDRSAGGA